MVYSQWRCEELNMGSVTSSLQTVINKVQPCLLGNYDRLVTVSWMNQGREMVNASLAPRAVWRAVSSGDSRTHIISITNASQMILHPRSTFLRDLHVQSQSYPLLLSLLLLFFFIVPITCYICVGLVLILASCYQQTFHGGLPICSIRLFQIKCIGVIVPVLLWYGRKCLVTIVNSVGYLFTNAQRRTFFSPTISLLLKQII